MKPRNLTIIKTNLSWQLLVEVSKSQQVFQLIRQPPTAFCGTEFQGWTGPNMGTQGLWCELAGKKVRPRRCFLCLRTQSRGTSDVHKQNWCLAPSQTHSRTRAWGCSGKPFWLGTWCPTHWICNLCTLCCQVPCYINSASELITCDWIKYFTLYLFLARTEFSSAVWDAKPLAIQTPCIALSATKIRTKGKSSFHVAAEDPLFNAVRLSQHSIFFQTNWKLNFIFAVFMAAY